MSSSEDSDAGPKRKRKLRHLEDSPASSSGSPIIKSISAFSRERNCNVASTDSDFSSSSSGSPILTSHKRKKVRITDSDSDSDASKIGRVRLGKPRRLESDDSFSSQWESDYSESENGFHHETNASSTAQNNNSDSEFSDGQSEKCPICLISFKIQEIGTPESCDHTFCLECIQEWSKNMNTCPIDRQEYNLILVRDNLNGKVTRQIPIDRPLPQNEVDIFEDPTACEICGSADHEDRMLLCDGCDLGFHLFCLTPPLDEVPTGSWYCNECGSNEILNNRVFELEDYIERLEQLEDYNERDRHLHRNTLRLIPRTRQSERVRRRIENNRQHNSFGNSSASTLSIDTCRSSLVVTSSISTPPKRTKKRKTKKSSLKIRYRTVYEIDKVTGETVAKKKRMKKQSRISSRNVRHGNDRPIPRHKTVKKRLAQQLGICATRTPTHNLPDVKIPSGQNNPSNNISGMRHSAGIPALHLFGYNNELDYFSEDNEDYSLGSQLLIRRAPNQSDISTMRRTIMRKNVLVPEVVSSSSDLLDSILNTQEQFYARNASFSLDSSGKFKVETKKSKSNAYIDVTKQHITAKEIPYHPNNNRNYNRGYNHYRYNQYNRYQNQRQSSNYYPASSQNYYHSEPSSSMNSGSFSGGDENDIPQDYSQRTLCATAESNLQGNEEIEEADEEGNAVNSESELDIYSDIETVTTSRTEDDPKPPSPPVISSRTPTIGTDEDNNDSEPDMVIDDDKIQEQEAQNACNREEAAVTSTVGVTRQFELESSGVAPRIITNNSMEIQSKSVQSSSFDEHISYQYYNDDYSYRCPNANIYSREVKPSNDEEVDSDDGCPNFSIYSKESKTLALHTDIGLSSTDRPGYQDYQVGEISSSPNVEEQSSACTEGQKNSQDSYDPNQIYQCSEAAIEENQNKSNPSEKLQEPTDSSQQTFNDPVQSYDPEKIYDQTDSPEGYSTYNADQTYDPETCLHQEETDKEFDADQSYDPEKIYDEESNSDDKSCDYEKEIFNYNSSGTKLNSIDPDVSNIGDRYDPAVPFNDDLDDSKSESQVLETDDTDRQTSMGEKLAVPSDLDEESAKKSIDVQKDDQPKESKAIIKGGILGGLYSDSEDDSIVKQDNSAFAISDINHMTEDISEEERSYTPCLDEKFQKHGLEGLDTEMISDEDRNDFDEAHELKTASDGGDALEINAKESELDFTRPEDYEEGEIVDKNKGKDVHRDGSEIEHDCDNKTNSDKPVEEKKSKKKAREKAPVDDKSGNKENEVGNNEASFRKLSKNTKDRNYRDKEKLQTSPKRSVSKDRNDYSKRDKKKEKRKELERYNVRAIIAEKPRPLIAKDQFGRDIRTTPSQSRSRSYTPPIRRSSSRPIRSPSKSRRSLSKNRRSVSARRRRSPSIDKTHKRRKSKNFRSQSRSRSHSPMKKDSAQKSKKRKRSSSRYRKRKSGVSSKSKKRLSRSRRRSRSATPLTRTTRDWNREWTPMSPSPPARMSPSWTPPRRMDNSQLLRNENLTVTVNNSNKKKRDKKRKAEKRNKEGLDRQKKRRREREKTPPPSKEVFASGDNILVSVSFNNDNETRDVSTRDKRKNDENKKRKEKRKKNKRDISGIKPVAIIDLDRSPFREMTPSPKQIIVLTDSDNEENDNLTNVQNNICDSSQQVASPERGIGPKTPPEPQVKFSLTVKPPQVRAINNPLHDPEDIETNDHVEDEMGSRTGPGNHIGPNTPPEPPNSPPSSPDAYDPFEPTKSRSPTPERQTQSKDDLDIIDSQAAVDLLDKSTNPMPEVVKSLTPPLADIQPADSQSSTQVTPDSNLEKSPDRKGVVQGIQSLSLKPVAQTVPFSSVPTPIITSTPIPSNIPTSRINILNSTIITPPVASSIPQRIVLPNQVKSSAVKISPTKMTIKATPIKPIANKNSKVFRKRVQNGVNEEIFLDFDSPYSPGSSDYEDLFEPPSEIVTKPVIRGKAKPSQKQNISVFDALFGSPTSNIKQKKNKFMKKSMASSKTKTVGVKLDEDNLKILDDLPNSAVEMQVKDKFLKKLNRQERVVEEVKLVLKPHYNKKRITKEEYKDIMRRSVPKICHNKSGEINPTKIKNLIEAYVRKIRHSKKVTSSSSVNPQK